MTSKEWALYKGDEFLAMGTMEEIAKVMGVQKKTIYFYTTPIYKKRSKDSFKRRVLVEL